MCLNKETTLDAVIDIILEKLDEGGTVTFTPNGTSMLPMLRDGQDIVMLKKPNGRLRLYEVALYKRENGQYVLHRVLDFGNDGSYIMCGDNQFKKEKGIKDSQIIAVLVGFVRKGRPCTTDNILYRIYISFWYHTRVFRRAFRSVKRRLGIEDKKNKKDKKNKENKKKKDTE